MTREQGVRAEHQKLAHELHDQMVAVRYTKGVDRLLDVFQRPISLLALGEHSFDLMPNLDIGHSERVTITGGASAAGPIEAQGTRYTGYTLEPHESGQEQYMQDHDSLEPHLLVDVLTETTSGFIGISPARVWGTARNGVLGLLQETGRVSLLEHMGERFIRRPSLPDLLAQIDPVVRDEASRQDDLYGYLVEMLQESQDIPHHMIAFLRKGNTGITFFPEERVLRLRTNHYGSEREYGYRLTTADEIRAQPSPRIGADIPKRHLQQFERIITHAHGQVIISTDGYDRFLAEEIITGDLSHVRLGDLRVRAVGRGGRT